MQKDIRLVDPEKGIVQITTIDSRWYARTETDPNTGLPFIAWRPSVTWICDQYPKGKGFEIWLKKNGWDSDELARLAADRGFKVHRAVAALNEGWPVNIDDSFEDHEGVKSPLSVEEYAGVMSYVDWWESEGCEKYRIIAWEYTLWPDAAALSEQTGLPAELFHYAGTVDLEVERLSDQTIGIIDLKTSLDIYDSAEMQVSAYKRARGADWAAILQLNYRRNKTKKWKFTEIADCFDLFAATRAIWKRQQSGVEPQQRDFPMNLKMKGREAPTI